MVLFDVFGSNIIIVFFFKLRLFGISKLIEMLRNLVVSPTEGLLLVFFFVSHWF